MNADTVTKISREMQALAESVDGSLEEMVGERIGFVLVVFAGHRASYVSNCDRDAVAGELRRLLDFWESGMPDIPAHEIT